jgi:arylsulfatase A-like enzyme
MKRECLALSMGLVVSAFLPWASASGESTTVPAATRPPNFVIIVADDLGWRDLGCYGSEFYETPAIDGLAAGGVRFTSAYAASPVCSPTRASFFSGKYPARLKLTDHTGGAQPEQWRDNTLLRPARYRQHLPLEEETFAEALHAAGYATFFAGKWHLGHADQYWPEYQGFDVNLGGTAAGGPFSGKQYFSPYGNPRLPNGPPGEHLDQRLATETVRFIEAHRHEPFLAVLSLYSVHVPLAAPEELRQKYERKRNPFGETPTPIWGKDGETRVRLVQEHAVYAAMVEAMDQAVGKVLAALAKQQLADNTVVLFTSDNGGLSTGDRAISADQGWPTSNVPLRAGKGWLYEGGIAVPLIARGPGVNASVASDDLVISADVYPTILDLAGLPPRPEQHADGVSFARSLRGESRERGATYWHYPHYSNQGGRPGAAIREGDWKLIRWFEKDSAELYQLRDDRGESIDLAAKEPATVARLSKKLDAWLKAVDAAMPTTGELP